MISRNGTSFYKRNFELCKFNLNIWLTSTVQVCLGVLPEGCVFLLLCNYVSLISLQIQFLWYMNLMNNGQMDRSNENPTQHLPWWLRKTTKNPTQVGRHRDLNPGPPECESRALPRSHLARSVSYCLFVQNDCYN